MARLACPEEAHATLHVVQRGREHGACFSSAKDRVAYLDVLGECSVRQACAVHAYALMGNHAHLLLTSERARGASRLMPGIVAGYARYLSGAYGHEDAVWEDAYDATPVHARRQLIVCMRYIEENPVRAGLAPAPEAWRWSSYCCNALGEEDRLVTPHAHYFSLGRSREERRLAYAAAFAGKALSSADGSGPYA